jgi:hypothetical protein
VGTIKKWRRTMMTEEDDEFKRIEMESGWRKRQIQKVIEDDDDIQDYKKPWRGLTDAETEYLSQKWKIIYGNYVTEFVEEIEAILRSKNT